MDILGQIEAAGIYFTLEDGEPSANIPEAVPQEVRETLQRNRETIKEKVLNREHRLRGYVEEAVHRLKTEGVVYIWSSVLSDRVAFCMDDRVLEVEEGVLYYTLSELKLLENTTFEEWRQLHRAKKVFGGQIVSVTDKEG